MPRIPPALVGFEPQRIDTVRRMIKGEQIATRPELSEGARITYVLGALRCNDQGYLSKKALDSASRNPRYLAAAQQLLIEAGWLGVTN